MAASWMMFEVMEQAAKETSPESLALVQRKEEDEEAAFLDRYGVDEPLGTCCRHPSTVVHYKDGDIVCSECGMVQYMKILVDPEAMPNMFCRWFIFQSSVQAHPLLQRADLPVAVPRHLAHASHRVERTACFANVE